MKKLIPFALATLDAAAGAAAQQEPGTQIRISANNLLAEDAAGYNLVYANGLAAQAASLNPTFTQWSVRLETKI